MEGKQVWKPALWGSTKESGSLRTGEAQAICKLAQYNADGRGCRSEVQSSPELF